MRVGMAGGAVLEVGGRVECRVGGRERVEGRVTTGRSVECKLPGRSQGNVTVEVSLNGEDWVGGGVQFRYRGICVTGAVVPSMGTEEGGTTVTVQGRGFKEGSTGGGGVWCRFGEGDAVAGHVVSDGEVRCVTPSSRSRPGIDGSLAVGLRVILGVVTLLDCRRELDFVYTSKMHVDGLHPRHLISDRARGVSVVGTGFGSGGQAYCRFAGADSEMLTQQWAVDGMVISSSWIRCGSPPGVSEGKMMVEVSRNGMDYTEDGWSVVYHKEATLAELRPSRGPEDGGSVVTVIGHGISREEGHGFCSFGGRPEPRSDFLSSSLVLCSAPKRTGGGNVTVDLVNGYDAEASSRGLRYEYTESGLALSTIFPSSGPIEGGTQVTVSGRWSDRASRISCIFNGLRMPSTEASGSSVVCPAPAHDAVGQVELRLQDSSGGSIGGVHRFEYRALVLPIRLTPSSGPLVGGSLITIDALGLEGNEQEVSCMFTGVDTHGEHRAVTAGRTEAGGRLACVAPEWRAETRVGVEVSTNGGVDFSHGGLRFGYERSPSVSAIYPTRILASATKSQVTTVTVYGKHFKAGRDIKCKLGSSGAATEAIYVSTTSILCQLTAREGRNAVLEVSSNGQEYSVDGVGLQIARAQLKRRFRISPSAGPIRGGPLVTVSSLGGGEENSSDMTLSFAGLTSSQSPRRVASTSGLVFLTPNGLVSENAVTSVRIYVGSVHVDSVEFQYQDAVEVQSIRPSFGPLQGATVIVVPGLHFMNDESLSCGFINGEHSNSTAEATDATKSESSGNGLQFATAGVLAQFTVTAKDESGVRRTSGGDEWIVELDGTRSITGSVVDNLDGTYQVSYTATKSGSYEAGVKLAKSGGLTGSYVENVWFFYTPVKVTVDPQINMDWGVGRITPTGANYISVRWCVRVRVHVRAPSSARALLLPHDPAPFCCCRLTKCAAGAAFCVCTGSARSRRSTRRRTPSMRRLTTARGCGWTMCR